MDRSEAGSPGRFSFLDRPVEESLGIGELLGSTEVAADDVGLRFYFEVLGLSHLHYGLWSDADPMTLEGLRRAQERYLDPDEQIQHPLPFLRATHHLPRSSPGSSARARR